MAEEKSTPEHKYFFPAPPPKVNTAHGLVGSIAGMVLGRYSGIFFLFPVLLMGAAYLFYRKWIFRNKQLFFLEASVLLCGHAGWLGAGMIALELQNIDTETLPMILNICECLLYLGLSFDLLRDPVVLLAIVMIFLELICFIINIVSIAQTEFGTDAHKALTVHLAIRGAIMVYGGIGLKKLTEFTKSQATKPETLSQST